MGLDLGALLSGITQGMGSAQDFKLAEQMRRAAEQRDLSQRRTLAGEAFGREKELRMLLDRLQGTREEERFTRESGRRETERAEDLALSEREMRLKYLADKHERERQGREDERKNKYYNYLMSRPPGGPSVSQDREASDAQIISAENAERSRLLKKRDSLEAEKRTAISPRQKKAVEAELKALTDDYIARESRKAGKRVRDTLQPRTDVSVGVTADPAEALMVEIEGGGVGAPGPEQPPPFDRQKAIEDTAQDIANTWRGGAVDVQGISMQLIDLVQKGELSVEDARAIMSRAKELYDADRAPTEQSLNSAQQSQLLQAGRYLK